MSFTCVFIMYYGDGKDSKQINQFLIKQYKKSSLDNAENPGTDYQR